MKKCKIATLDKCECEQTTTKCSFGPDSRGSIILYQTFPDENADVCERSFCTCTSHDNYEEVLAERIGEHTVIPGPDATEEEPEIRPDEEPEAEIFGLSDEQEEQILSDKPVENEPSDPLNDGIITSFDVPDKVSDENKEFSS